jgi:predicted transcriptional regulator
MKRRRDEIDIIAAILECIINNKNHKAKVKNHVWLLSILHSAC